MMTHKDSILPHDQDDLFSDEQVILDSMKTQYAKGELQGENVLQIINEYEDLLLQSKIVTRVSDRVQHKLDIANEKITAQNDEINRKNEELRHTIKELTKARLRRKASAFMLIVFIIIFLVEEFVIEKYFGQLDYAFWIDITIKLSTAFFLKSMEGSLEKFLMHMEQRRIVKRIGEDQNKTEALFRYYRMKLKSSMTAKS